MENPSGFIPVDLRVLVRPDPAEEKIGNIFVPDSAKDKAKFAGTKATLIAAGDNAFSEWGSEARKPKPGDRVHFAQYTGAWIKGEDGAEYLVMNDKDITGILEAAQ